MNLADGSFRSLEKKELCWYFFSLKRHKHIAWQGLSLDQNSPLSTSACPLLAPTTLLPWSNAVHWFPTFTFYLKAKFGDLFRFFIWGLFLPAAPGFRDMHSCVSTTHETGAIKEIQKKSFKSRAVLPEGFYFFVLVKFHNTPKRLKRRRMVGGWQRPNLLGLTHP